jgi:hypothetical protein
MLHLVHLVRLLVLRLYSHTRRGITKTEMARVHVYYEVGERREPATLQALAAVQHLDLKRTAGTNLCVPSAPKCYSNVCQCGLSTRTTVGVL